MKLEKITRDFIKTLTEPQKKRTAAYDSKGIVTRIEEGIAWVKLAGSKIETPIQMTISAEPGDEVQARIGNGTGWLTGNGTAPPTDDKLANRSYKVAVKAVDKADEADEKAIRAAGAAADAQDSAVAAQRSADAAQASATAATGYANVALDQLGVVENVVGVLELLQKNGEYQLTLDTKVQPLKWYFTRTGTSPNYEYSVVSNPTGNPSTSGWYELTSISQSIQNYISSHLVLSSDGLWLLMDATQAKIQLSTDGVTLYGTDGTKLAKYGAKAIIGNLDGFHIEIDGQEIGFYQGGNKVAYMNGSELYVTNSLSFGHYIFYERANGHFTLKRIT